MLVGVGASAGHENLRFLEAQARAEGGTAEWNPLNSTLPLVGWMLTPDYNKTGVKRYAYPTAGVCATILTLISRNPDGTLRFKGLLGDLQAGLKTAEQIVEANRAEISQWGSSPDLMLAILKDLP